MFIPWPWKSLLAKHLPLNGFVSLWIPTASSVLYVWRLHHLVVDTMNLNGKLTLRSWPRYSNEKTKENIRVEAMHASKKWFANSLYYKETVDQFLKSWNFEASIKDLFPLGVESRLFFNSNGNALYSSMQRIGRSLSLFSALSWDENLLTAKSSLALR